LAKKDRWTRCKECGARVKLANIDRHMTIHGGKDDKGSKGKRKRSSSGGEGGISAWVAAVVVIIIVVAALGVYYYLDPNDDDGETDEDDDDIPDNEPRGLIDYGDFPITPTTNKSRFDVLTDDGFLLNVTLYPSKQVNASLLMLVHGMNEAQSNAWEEGFIGKLQTDGFNVLTYDLRGHGLSIRKNQEEVFINELTTKDYELMVSDLGKIKSAAVSKVKTSGKIGVIGASIGANTALKEGIDDPFIKTLVLLSPGYTYRVPLTGDDATQFGERPILFMAAKEDIGAHDTSSRLWKESLAEHPDSDFAEFDGNPHGSNLLKGGQGDQGKWAILHWMKRWVGVQ